MALTTQQIDEALLRIASGESQASIARSLGMDPGNFCRELQRTEDIAQRSARARADSAEAWLDKGLEVIESALRRDSGIDAQAARAYAQECARRAAVRNPAYRDKVDSTVRVTTGPETLSDAELAAIVKQAPRGG